MQLNVEQRRIIESKPSGHMLIKGVAGSGKTTVAVNKIPLLLSHYSFEEDDNILMATYNKSLSKYVSYIYEKAKEEADIQMNLFRTEEMDKLDIKTIDALIFFYFNKYKKENKKNIKIADRDIQKKALLEAIKVVSNKYEDISIVSPGYLNFIRDEIVWIKACNYLEIEEYQNVDRTGRVTKANLDGPQKLKKNSEKRKAIFEVMEIYNEELAKDKYIDFQDMVYYAIEEARKNSTKKYTHIIVDESQDLSRMQIEFLKCLYNEKEYSSIVFITDVAQSIYAHAWLVKNRSFTSIGYDMTGKSYSLSKNYRTTTQIAQAAYSVIAKDKDLLEDHNFVKPNLIDKQGLYPIYRNFKDKQDEAKYICRLIKEFLMKNYELRDIVIISRLTNALDEMKGFLDENLIPNSIFKKSEEFDFSDDKVKLVTMHSIKGLEFKVVIMIGMNSKSMPYNSIINEFEDKEEAEERERKLFYVGMTRATERLIITSDGKPSKFIKDIDYRYIRMKENCAINRIRQIHNSKYIFTDKIRDIYSEEEKVRQWVLKELIETYKYPIELIDVEKNVYIGSNKGLVDISIDIYRNNTKNPYIFIEVKRWGMGIDEAIGQLKSYLSSCNTVMYGVATDGNEISIINSNFEEIDDIPKFDSSMMPSTLEIDEFINLKWNTRHQLMMDSSNPKEIYIEDEGDKVNKIVAIPIYNEIAAGNPILINEEKQGEYYLPEEWVGNSNELFLLKIKGDSMINKDICNEDYVLIKKQNIANIGEVVAVEIDGDSTLKTYKTMGGKALFVPENDEYEPFMLDEGQFNIIGVAVGILKRNSNQ